MWAQQLLSQGLQNMGNSKAAQVVLMGLLSPHLTMDPHSQPIVLVSSSEVSNEWGGFPENPVKISVKGNSNGHASSLPQHLQRFLQCSTYLSHSHSPMQYMATFSPPKQVITS